MTKPDIHPKDFTPAEQKTLAELAPILETHGALIARWWALQQRGDGPLAYVHVASDGTWCKTAHRTSEAHCPAMTSRAGRRFAGWAVCRVGQDSEVVHPSGLTITLPPHTLPATRGKT